MAVFEYPFVDDAPRPRPLSPEDEQVVQKVLALHRLHEFLKSEREHMKREDESPADIVIEGIKRKRWNS